MLLTVRELNYYHSCTYPALQNGNLSFVGKQWDSQSIQKGSLLCHTVSTLLQMLHRQGVEHNNDVMQNTTNAT